MSQFKQLITSGETAVTAAGTRQHVIASTRRTAFVFFQASPNNNTGVIYIGDKNVSASNYFVALLPGQGWAVEASQLRGINGEFDLSDFYYDASVNGSKVTWTYEAAK